MGQPTKIGKYEILAELGHGGMGVVYKALDRQLNRLVAIKMIIGATPGLLKRFNVEARSTAGLQHPNIVTIYDFGEQDGSPYLVMQFLEGMSLDAVIKSGKSLSLASKLNICVEICNGLHYAHERGIIHRDIKPGNVMVLEDGGVTIVDFGIARIGDTGISRTELVGSLNYMSPEQFQGEVLDRRVDIWSTGVLFYQLLTTALPFPAADDAATMYKILHQDPPPLGTYIQNYPPELDQILAKALSKNRDARYFTAHDFAFDILAILDQQKHVEVSQWLKRAETAVQKTDWSKAEDYLRQILRIDKHHTQAHQLLSKVQVQIRTQRQVEQARQLRIQADGAFLERRYDEALNLIEQAISLDKANEGLASFRESIREAKTRASEFKSAIRQAEEAQHAGDLDEAKLAVQRALEIDPQETSAKALQAAILREVDEHERSKKLRTLLDRGRDQIAIRDLTGALTTLKQAENIDPASAELFSLLKVVHAARDEQLRKAEVEKLARLIEDSLSREDYASAVAIANEALQRYPQDKGLLQFKSLAETQHHRVQLKTYAKEQFVAARRLLDEGRNPEALSLIETALQSVPNDFELDTLRNVAESRLATEQKEERKRNLMRRAQDLAAAEKFQEALLILEELRAEFPEWDEVQSLMRAVQASRERETAAREVRRRAEEANALRLRHIAELNVLTRSIQAEPEPSKLRQFTQRIGDLKERYGEDSEVQSSVSNATRVVDARLASLQKLDSASQGSATKVFGSAGTPTPDAREHQATHPLVVPAPTPDVGEIAPSEHVGPSRSRFALIAAVAVAVAVVVVGGLVIGTVLSRSSASWIRIATVPTGATVSVGSQRCTDPNCEMKLRAGNYTAEAHLEGYQPASESFSVTSGQRNSTVTLTLKPLEPTASNSTNESVPVDASPAAPVTPKNMPAPVAGPVKGMLKVTALFTGGGIRPTPVSGADVLVDGKYYGETGSNGALSVPLPPRQYTVAISKKGYTAQGSDQRIELRAGEQTNLNFALQPTAAPPTQALKTLESKAAGPTGTPGAVVQKPTPTPVQIANGSGTPAAAIPTPSSSAPAPVSSNSPARPSSSNSGTSPQPAPSASPGSPSIPSHAPTETSTTPSLMVSDKKAIATALEQYKEAYESESMDELLKIWPSMSKDQKKALKAGFESAQAIRVSLSCGDPTILGDAATVKCNQEVKYTRSGKVEPPQTVSVDIILKKKQTMWLVGTVRAN